MPVTRRFLAATILCGTLSAQTTRDAVEAYHKGQYAQARQQLEAIVQKNSSDPVTRAMLGLSRAATGACDTAVDDLRQQFSANPDTTLRRLTGIALVQCQLTLNRSAEVWPALEQLQKTFPGDADVLYQTAKVHMKAWNDAVFQMYQKAPASFRVNQLSGEIFEIQGRYQEAAAEYRKAIEKNSAALNLHFRLGRALLLQSHEPTNLSAALREFETELTLNPFDAVAEYQVGQILMAQQKPIEAAARYAKAVALNPEFGEALIALAKTKSEAKQDAEAIRLLERAVELQPSNESAHYALMIAYRNAGRAADAERERAVIDKLKQPAEGEFAEFLKKLGEKTPKQ